MHRLALVALLGCSAAAPRPAAAPDAPFPFAEATIASLQAQMSSGALTSRALTEAYLARIRAIDPQLHSVLEVNPDALQIAQSLDDERRARGPLHGIPVLVKDNLATADKMQTTAGSLALVGAHAPRDSAVVARLRKAGAVILGKTNLSEWANIRSTHSSSGWSARGGQARNPYALDRTPCGSSSGTGAAIAANLAVAGIGTETDGSIVCPSGSQSLVGVKPTVGLVSRAGIVPISHTQDTAGPMARTVEDAAIVLAAIAGADADDEATAQAKPFAVDFDGASLEGVRIGVPRAKLFGNSPAADRVTEEAIAVLKAQGAEIVDPADIPHLGEYDDAEQEVLLTELKADLESYLRAYAPDAKVKTLADAVDFNRAHAADELRFFGQELFEQAEKKGPLTSPEYRKAKETCRKLAREEGLDAAFAQHRLDALLAATGGPPWTIDLVTGDHFIMSSSTPAAVAGYPAVTVPAGYEHGLPMSVTFMGKAWDEAKLLRIARAFEQATHARRPPGLRATAELP